MKLIEMFIDNFNGVAFIRPIDKDEITYSNKHFKTIFGSVHISTLALLISDQKNPIVTANLKFCQFVEEQCKETLSSVFAKEIFNSKKYITLRMLINYKGLLSILTLISNCEIDPTDNCSNEIHINSLCELLPL